MKTLLLILLTSSMLSAQEYYKPVNYFKNKAATSLFCHVMAAGCFYTGSVAIDPYHAKPANLMGGLFVGIGIELIREAIRDKRKAARLKKISYICL